MNKDDGMAWGPKHLGFGLAIVLLTRDAGL